MGNTVAPADIPLNTTPLARLLRLEKWWEVILTYRPKLREGGVSKKNPTNCGNPGKSRTQTQTDSLADEKI
jgi:hypothetical protein